jgi:hypothetical protein
MTKKISTAPVTTHIAFQRTLLLSAIESGAVNFAIGQIELDELQERG